MTSKKKMSFILAAEHIRASIKERGDEGLNDVEAEAEKCRNVSLMFSIQILRELREIKKLLDKEQNTSNSSND